MRLTARLLTAREIQLDFEQIDRATVEVWDFISTQTTRHNLRIEIAPYAPDYPLVVYIHYDLDQEAPVTAHFQGPTDLTIRLNPQYAPEKLYEELASAMIHEVAHYVQFQFHHPLGSGDMNENNYEAKALSSELCNDYRARLKEAPDLSPNKFLNKYWKWEQIKTEMDPKFRNLILKDLACVGREKIAFPTMVRSIRYQKEPAKQEE